MFRCSVSPPPPVRVRGHPCLLGGHQEVRLALDGLLGGHLTRHMLHVTCYILRVTCYMLHVTCYLLHTTCYVLYVTCYMLLVTAITTLTSSSSCRPSSSTGFKARLRLLSSSSLLVTQVCYIAKSWSTKQFERKKQFGNQFYL